jgi:hypothetical protein
MYNYREVKRVHTQILNLEKAAGYINAWLIYAL